MYQLCSGPRFRSFSPDALSVCRINGPCLNSVGSAVVAHEFRSVELILMRDYQQLSISFEGRAKDA
jgi:hypothetical protein